MLSDTSAEAERVQIELLRQATVTQRLNMALEMSDFAFGLALRAIARADAALSGDAVKLRFVELHYGADLAKAIRTAVGNAVP